MSAIGDYVHYYKSNYRRWGTNKVLTTPSKDWNTTLGEVKKTINAQNKLNAAIAEARELEQKYNRYYYSDSALEDSVIFRKNLETRIQNDLNRQYGALAGRVNLDTLSVEPTALQKQFRTAVTQLQKRYGMLELKKETTVRKLKYTIDSLLLLLQEDNLRAIREIQADLVQAKNTIDSLRANLKSLTNVDIPARATDIESINKIIIEFNRVPSLYDQNQLLFEWLVPFIGLKVDKTAKEGLREAINNLGENVSTSAPDLDNTIDVVDIDVTFDNVKMKSISTLNESVVYLTYSDKPDTLGNLILKKNTFENKDFNLIDSKSFYDALNLTNTSNFSNHYLNIVTKANGRGSDDNSIIEANKMFKSLLLNTIQIPALNYLVVNDQEQRKISVFSIKAMIYLIQLSFEEKESKYSSIFSFNNKTTIEHSWAKESKEVRIAEIVNKLQQEKLTARIRGKDIPKYICNA